MSELYRSYIDNIIGNQADEVAKADKASKVGA